jgi:hypothetical protein
MRARAFVAVASPERIGECGRERFLDQRLHRRAAIRRPSSDVINAGARQRRRNLTGINDLSPDFA